MSAASCQKVIKRSTLSIAEPVFAELPQCALCRDCILDCRAHTHLQHVHLANFAPTEYHFGDGCKVHGKWLDTKKEFAKFADWAGAEIWYHAAVKSMTVQRPFASCRQPGWVTPLQ